MKQKKKSFMKVLAHQARASTCKSAHVKSAVTLTKKKNQVKTYVSGITMMKRKLRVWKEELQCPWARQWLPTSCGDAIVLLTMTSDLLMEEDFLHKNIWSIITNYRRLEKMYMCDQLKVQTERSRSAEKSWDVSQSVADKLTEKRLTDYKDGQ